jgi:hypothetical protein
MRGRPAFQGSNRTSKKVGSNMAGTGENFVLTRNNMPKLKEQLQMAIKQIRISKKLKSPIEITVTTEGLRIELSESASGTFFDSGSARLNRDGSEMLITLAQELGNLPNKTLHRGSHRFHTPTLRLRPTEIENSLRIAPTRPVASCKPTVSGLTR